MIWTEVQRDRHFPILHNSVGALPGPKWIYSWLNERNFLPGGWFCLLSFWLSCKQLQHGLEIFNFQSKIFLSNWLSISQAAWSSTTMERLAQRMSVSWSGSSSLAAGELSWWYYLEERLRSIPSCALISFCPAESLMIELGQNRLMMDLWIRKSYNTHLDKTCSFDNTLTVDEIWHGMTTEIYWWFNKFIIKIDKPCT